MHFWTFAEPPVVWKMDIPIPIISYHYYSGELFILQEEIVSSCATFRDFLLFWHFLHTFLCIFPSNFEISFSVFFWFPYYIVLCPRNSPFFQSLPYFFWTAIIFFTTKMPKGIEKDEIFHVILAVFWEMQIFRKLQNIKSVMPSRSSRWRNMYGLSSLWMSAGMQKRIRTWRKFASFSHSSAHR